MKKLIALLMLLSMGAQAGEFQATLFQAGGITDDDTYFRGDWYGLKFSYQFDDSNNFVFASHERMQIIPFWGIGNISMTGVGFGSKFNVTDNVRFFGSVGAYLVKHDGEGRHDMHGPNAGDYGEGMGYYFNNRYLHAAGHAVGFDEYEIRYDDTLAGEVGFELTSGSVVYSLSYRSMKVREFLRVYKDEWKFDETGVCWEQQNNRNFDSVNFGIGWRF